MRAAEQVGQVIPAAALQEEAAAAKEAASTVVLGASVVVPVAVKADLMEAEVHRIQWEPVSRNLKPYTFGTPLPECPRDKTACQRSSRIHRCRCNSLAL